MNKMSPEIKARWVAALRSGRYRQRGDYLKVGGEFCCLGVLCDLHSRATGEQWEPATAEGPGEIYGGEKFSLPTKVIEWAGLWADDIDLSIDGESKGAAGHNDNGHTFAEIADAIEEQL